MIKIYSIDIETLDLNIPKAVVTSIAWVDVGSIVNGELYCTDLDNTDRKWKYVLSSEHQTTLGRTISEETILFREHHNGAHEIEISKTLSKPDNVKSLQNLASFNKLGYWFAQGTDFDFPIVADLMRQYGFKPPWDYWAKMDLRTITTMGEVKHIRAKIPHDSLSDAIAQGKSIQTMEDIYWERLENEWSRRNALKTKDN